MKIIFEDAIPYCSKTYDMEITEITDKILEYFDYNETGLTYKLVCYYHQHDEVLEFLKNNSDGKINE